VAKSLGRKKTKFSGAESSDLNGRSREIFLALSNRDLSLPERERLSEELRVINEELALRHRAKLSLLKSRLRGERVKKPRPSRRPR